jgi:hypothetical protein
MGKVGRPPTRSREPVLIAIYRLIGNELLNHQHGRWRHLRRSDLEAFLQNRGETLSGGKSVLRACRRLIERHKLGFRFRLNDTNLTQINIFTAEELRREYNIAKNSIRYHRETYPHLCEVADQLEWLIRRETSHADSIIAKQPKQGRGRPPLGNQGLKKKRIRIRNYVTSQMLGKV